MHGDLKGMNNQNKETTKEVRSRNNLGQGIVIGIVGTLAIVGLIGVVHMYDMRDMEEMHEEYINQQKLYKEKETETTTNKTPQKQTLRNYNKPIAETHNNTFDFGSIKRSNGPVSTTFEIENHGRKPLKIENIATSCGCTSAKMDKDIIEPNSEGTLTVTFDPNFHKEPQGKITRSVFVKTNDTETPELQFDIYVQILEE